MALPSFGIDGDLYRVLGRNSNNALVKHPLPARVYFTSNLAPGYPIKADDSLVWIERCEAVVAEDGTLVNALDGQPVRLLANDPSLGLERPLQWTIEIHVPIVGRSTPHRVSWTFEAPADGETLDLETAAPEAWVETRPIMRGPRGYSITGVTLNGSELVFSRSDDQPDIAVEVPSLEAAAAAAEDALEYASDAQGFAADAQAYAAAAHGHASNAQGHANDASGFADDAHGWADAAAQSADLADEHAEAAAASALAASSAVTEAIEELVGTAPSTLDTLQELASAIANDPDFAVTITNLIATKQPKFMAGTCVTAAATAAKTVTLDSPWASHTIAAGDILAIKFANGQTATSPTLAVNGGSAYAITTAAGVTASGSVAVGAGKTVVLLFDGSSYTVFGATQNSTYAEIGEDEIDDGSSSAARSISGRRAAYLLGKAQRRWVFGGLVSSNRTLLPWEQVTVDVSALTSDITLTLPATPANGDEVAIFLWGSNADHEVFVDANGRYLIDASTGVDELPMSAFRVLALTLGYDAADGSWRIVGTGADVSESTVAAAGAVMTDGTVTRAVALTQAEYDALPVKDPQTLYVIQD